MSHYLVDGKKIKICGSIILLFLVTGFIVDSVKGITIMWSFGNPFFEPMSVNKGNFDYNFNSILNRGLSNDNFAFTLTADSTRDRFLDYQKEKLSATTFIDETLIRKSNFFRDMFREVIINEKPAGFIMDSRFGQDVGTGSMGFGLTSLAVSVQLGLLGEEWKENIYHCLQGLRSIQELQPEGEWLELTENLPYPLIKKLVEVKEERGIEFLRNADLEYFSDLIKNLAIEEGYLEEKAEDISKDLDSFFEDRVSRETIINLVELATLEDVERLGDYGMGGWFYHYFYPSTGKRTREDVEISTVDTAILLMGTLYAGEVFRDYKPEGVDKTMQELAQEIFRNVDWDEWFVFFDGDISHGWRPILPSSDYNGQIKNDYWGDERLILEMLRIGWLLDKNGIVTEGVDYSKKTKFRTRGIFEDRDEPIHYASFQGAAWTYQYAHLFFNFFGEDIRGISWYENTVKALIGNINYSMHKGDLERNNWFFGEQVYKGYYPYDAMVSTMSVPRDEEAHPGEAGFQMDHGTTLGFQDSQAVMNDGTFSPSAFAGSLAYLPFRSWQTLRYHYVTSLPLTRVAGTIHPYLFSDSINRRQDWFSTNNYTLNEGVFFLGMVNALEDGLIWETFKSQPLIKNALDELGLNNSPQQAPVKLLEGFDNIVEDLESERSYSTAEAAVGKLYQLAKVMTEYHDERVLPLFKEFLNYSDRISESIYNILGEIAEQTSDMKLKVKALTLQFVVAKNNLWIADQVRIFRDNLIPLINKNPELLEIAEDIVYQYDYEFQLIAGKYNSDDDGEIYIEYGLFGPEEVARETIRKALQGDLAGIRVYYPDIFRAGR